MTGCLYDSFFLHFVQNSLCFFLNLQNLLIHHFRFFRIQDIQFFEHSCRIQLQIIIQRRINKDLSVLFLLDQLTVHRKIHEVLFHVGGIHTQKL